MRAFDFMPGMTITLAKDQDQYFPLPVIHAVYVDGTKAFISAWKASFKDKIRLLLGKPVYLAIMTQAQSPPVLLTTNRRTLAIDTLEKAEVKDGKEI